MSAEQAVDAVLTDIRDHSISADRHGLFHVTRHLSLLCHLTARFAGEAEYQLSPNAAGLPPRQSLARTAVHLGKAVGHYTQALPPLHGLAAQAPGTLPQQLEAIGLHSRLRVQLDDARQALESARTALHGPPPHTVPASRPAAPASRAANAPSGGRR
ncbi:hypothetical protein ACFYVL_09440 [Streptomyces sp. NPDC004111]|uniref:hypothetical protein n=1 Tax=Streptomyces sp. NPDC004111 TaxID=3364690 RepID=UPI00369EB5EE